MAKEHLKGSNDELNAIFQKRCQQEMSAERKKLLAEHRLSPTMIMAIPALTQLPVFVLSSLVFTRMTQAPSGLDAESFWTLTSLVNPDPTATIPVVLGLVTFANVESSNWFITDAQKARQEKVDRWNADKRAQGHIVLEPKKLVQNGLRMLSVGRILVAAMVPGAVEIYWLASASFGLLQSWVFDYLERRRAMRSTPTKPKSSSLKPLRII